MQYWWYIFTLLASIVGNLFMRHPKNPNHLHKYRNDLLSVIIILGTDVHGGERVILNGMTMNDIGKRAHVLKNLHGRCVVGAFDKIYTRALFGLEPELFYILTSTNEYFFTMYIMLKKVMTNICNLTTEINILMMMGVVFFQNKRLDSFIIKNTWRHILIK